MSELEQLKEEINRLKNICRDLAWMARRYADGRSSYAVSAFNEAIRELQGMGVKFNPTGDDIIWARDACGRQFDGLTEEEATPGTPAARGE